MTPKFIAAAIAFVLLEGFWNLSVYGEQPLQVANLRCEYLTDPLGIDIENPRLSWQIQASDSNARGVVQSAYQILVASTEKNLESDRGDLWDTGRVESDQSIQIVYRGRPLSSRTYCYWKVRVWNQKDEPSRWSSPAKWSMGLLKSLDWKAQWIGVETKTAKADNDPWFRKGFSTSGKPVRALIYVASIGYHELFINDKRVGDRVLSPSISDLSQRVRYVAYDVTDYLQEGPNAVGLWCATGWAAFHKFKVKDKPLVMAQLEIEQPDGQSIQVVTDATWKTRAGPMSQLGNWQGGFGGELYDAALELPGWSGAKLDESGWNPVAVFSPKVQLSAEMIEPNRRIETIEPVAIEERDCPNFRLSDNGTVPFDASRKQIPKVYRIDMGRNFAGWLRIQMKGSPGQKVTLQFSERPNQTCSFNQKSEYRFGKNPVGEFCHRFNHSVARWITISGLASPPVKGDIRGYLVSTDIARAGHFECSNPLLNRIYETTLLTFRSLSSGGYIVDCPHRERMGYGGDAHATMETAMMNFDAGAFYTKWLGDWRDVQGPDGNLPYTAPTYVGGGGPAWSGICVALPWQVYLHYGDRRVLEDCYPTMQRWLAFLQTKSKDNLLQSWGGIWDFLGDWVPPGVGQGVGKRVDDRSTLFFNNCYYFDNVATVAKVADLLGKPDDAEKYRKLSAAIAQAAHKQFYNPEKHSYANGTQLYAAMPLLFGITPEALRGEVGKHLEHEILVTKKGHLDTGIHGTYYLIKSLLGQNRNDLIFKMANKKTYPGWGHMLEKGATTIWEEWGGDNSLLHSSFLSIGSWFIEGLAGIQLDPAQPGYKHFFIRPGVVGDLTWAKGRFDSPYGRIISDWKLSDGWLTVTVEVPANASATVILPTDDPASVTESGQPAGQSPGVIAIPADDHTAAYKISSGRYIFRTKKRAQASLH
jgi:alpha-L-rhamnosidase